MGAVYKQLSITERRRIERWRRAKVPINETAPSHRLRYLGNIGQIHMLRVLWAQKCSTPSAMDTSNQPVGTFFADLPFRGTRAYVHSASLGNLFAQRFGRWEHFEITLKNWMTNRVWFTLVDSVRAGSGAGHVIIDLDGQRHVWEISEDPQFPVIMQEPYDEDALASPTAVTDRKIDSVPVTGASFFDRLIAANKMLINTTLDPQVKLIAAKISVDGFLDPQKPFTLELASHLGNKIFKSKILTRDTVSGEVIFYGG